MKEFNIHGLRLNFTPKCYLCRPSIIVLEDLSLEGYQITPKKNMLDVRHCKVALKSLAQFHAPTLIYEDIKSNADKSYVNLLKLYPDNLNDVLFSEPKNAAKEWLESTFIGLINLIDHLPEADISAVKYKRKLADVVENSSKYSELSTENKNTVLHGDLWSNNIMFKYENGIPVDSIIIDYQVLKYGPMAYDVVQMILTNVRRSVRDAHYEELLSYYYHQFVEYCDDHHFDAHQFISYKGFMQSCEEAKINAKLQCVADHSITFLIDEAVEEIFQSDEEIKKFFFGDRTETMIYSFKENDMYREILTEDLVELRDMLFSF